ncbi:MAG: hypothetical protein ABII00_04300, partial [Elusimicrobiota bacterium]
EVVPLYRISLLGGQYFFSSDKSNLNANIRAQAAPVVKLDEEWSLLPIYSSYFRGTKSVSDSVGSGTLFQQGMDHRLGLGAHYKPEYSPWRFKSGAHYKWEFLKETRDETWGQGLFDYEKIGVGFEAENVYREPFSYRFGYDFYYIRFPNYNSLESQSGVDPNGNPLGRETAGTDVLDTFNQELSFTATRPYPYEDPKVSLQASYRFLWQTFADQPIINRQGQPNGNKPYDRQDFNNSLTLSVGYPRQIMGGKIRMGLGFRTGFTYNGSNQNTFDAGQTIFIPDSYSYTSVSAGPNASFSWGDNKNPFTAGAGITYTRLQYTGRRIQNGGGVYQDDKQHQDRYLLTLTYGYPIVPNFRLMAQTSVLWARSNMAYEKTYRYNYSTANYLFGFTYDY